MQLFRKKILGWYRINGRQGLLWRKNPTAYRVYVSEIMLQQTQVDRVTSFYKKWMKEFPTIKVLADAPQSKILALWKGLGYNSRALRMKKAAQMIVKDFKGFFPKKYDDILSLPGVGPYTAGAISAFAYNQPAVMIETNIRRVFIHEFFQTSPGRLRRPPSPARRGSEHHPRALHTLSLQERVASEGSGVRFGIHDKEILKLVEKTLDKKNPREWYWALMDYGSYLGKTIPNPNKQSRHYTKQSKFKGSDREIRGKILEILLVEKKVAFEKLEDLLKMLSTDQERIERIVDVLEKEGFLIVKKGVITLY